MLKYYGDLLEKLTAGAFVIGIFQRDGSAWVGIIGLILLVIWHKVRKEELAKKEDEKLPSTLEFILVSAS